MTDNNNSIDCFAKLTLTAGHVFDARPGVGNHAEMVEHVQESNLIFLFPQRK